MNKGFIRRPFHLLYIGLGTAVVVLSGSLIDGGRVLRGEEVAFYAINRMPDLLFVPAWCVMQLGNLFAAPLAGVVAVAMRRLRLGAALATSALVKLQVARVVKSEFHRQRPSAVIDDVIRRGDASAAGQAFVSGHAIIAFALATLVVPYLSSRLKVAAWGLATAVCLGRIYVGAHLPLDVVGGAALGWGVGSVLNLVVGVPRPREDPEPTSLPRSAGDRSV